MTPTGGFSVTIDKKLREKNKKLEKQIKEKDQLLKKYEKVLKDSNDRIKTVSEELKNSLTLIRTIHNSLIPVSLPSIPSFDFSFKFLPARLGVSGDFFNVIPINKKMKFGIVLSSCTSHSLSSLFVSSFLKSSLEMDKYESSKDFAKYVYKKVAPALKSKEKMHLFYAVICRRTFEMDYFLSGDIFVGLSSSSGVKKLKAHSLHLGASKDFKSSKLNLKSKDQLLLCSSGVSSAKNKKGDKFNSQILKAFKEKSDSSVLELRQSVLFHYSKFAGKEQESSDRTLLAMKVQDKILKLEKTKKA